MSVLGKIREKTALLLGVIIVGLGVFLLQDLIGSKMNFSGADDRNVAEIYGEDVSYEEFDAILKEVTFNFQSSQRRSPNEQETKRLQNEAWQKLLFEKAYRKQFEELGIIVTGGDSESEEVDMVQGETIHPYILQNFTNPQTGQYDPEQVINFLKQIKDPQNDQQIAAKDQWSRYTKDLIVDRLRTKYINLIAKTNFVTTAEAERENDAKNAKVDVEYVYVPYSAINDSTITVTDEILKEYINEYGYKYDVTASRSVSYVSFDVKPTTADKDAILANMNDIKASFATAVSDTLFVQAKAETAGLPSFVTTDNLPFSIKSDSTNLVVDSVYGPHLVGNAYYLYKISAIEESDSAVSVGASHILFSTPETMSPAQKDSVKAVAQSVLNKALNGDNFAALATQYSEDPGSKSRGGSLGVFGKGQMVPPFENAAFGASKTGVVAKLVETRFGYHIINVTDIIKKQYLVSTIDKGLRASKRTRDSVYRQANIFLSSCSDLEALKSNAVDNGLGILSADNVLKSNNGFGKFYNNGRSMVRWAFEQNEAGAVATDIYEIGDSYVVLAVSKVVTEGDKDLEVLREKIEAPARNNLKALEIGGFWASATADLEAAKGQLGTKVNQSFVVSDKASVSLADRTLGRAGSDQEFVGAACGVTEGGVSKPVIGESGVLLVKGVKAYPAPEASSYEEVKQTLLQAIQYRDTYMVDQAITDDAEVVDNRVKFF